MVDKQTIMESKTKLKQLREETVYINHNLSKMEEKRRDCKNWIQ